MVFFSLDMVTRSPDSSKKHSMKAEQGRKETAFECDKITDVTTTRELGVRFLR
jgi:hypothetical protein